MARAIAPRGHEMATHGRGERGVVLALAAMFLTAIIAMSAVALEVSRLTDTATEVQVAADAAALAAAQNMIKGGTSGPGGTATTAAQTVAAKNGTDGRTPAAAEVSVEFGTYSAATGFTLGAANNAVRATVSLGNVRYLLASVFGTGATTTVTKRAVATYACTGQTQPTAPLTICDCSLQQYTNGQPCSGAGGFTQTPNGSQNSCLLASPSGDNAWFPKDCPSVGTGTAGVVSVGDNIGLLNGQSTPVLRDFASCVSAGVHDYVIPIVHCPSSPSCATNCTGTGSVVGFATIHIAQSSDIDSHGSPKTIGYQQICNNNASGTGGATGATCFGSGNATLVDDRG
jgi:putative Flp pilus-assembly TadE/G-like protein